MIFQNIKKDAKDKDLNVQENRENISPDPEHEETNNNRSSLDSRILDDGRFCLFAYLVALISEAEIFKKANGSKQFPIGLHLAIVLYRLGSSGESASIRKVATTFGIGDGATLMKITQRIFSVFITLLTKYIVWPSSSEQEQIISDTYNELPFCIGYIDGTEIKIADAPQINQEKYFSRNHIYSIKLQAVCDYKLRIRDVVVGYEGSTHDAKVFSNSILLKEKDRFFSNQSWIA
ncbi:protein ALP1-like [Teleopsis dalmanni]|uniref:protein ALP1-like n=1 Tax=Teleopsis dalmanni TaxID=139649 RepID=UPI0018CD8AE4|nr:protein ALP1-like [Teleopsis dalmanni]XP_037932651.1 protein ALP1-like [Teleopsis dalmanni]